MRTLLLSAMLIVAANETYSSEPEAADLEHPAITAYAESSDKARTLQLAKAPQTIANAKAVLSAAKRKRYESAEEKRAALARAQAQYERVVAHLSQLEDPFVPFYRHINVKDLTRSSIGRLDWDQSVVRQVIDKENMLVDLSWVVPSHKVYGTTGNSTVVKTVDEKNVLVWIQGMNTSKFADGDDVWEYADPNLVFKANGTKTYRTQGGSNSVPVLAVIDMTPYEDYFNRTNQMRVWKDSTGKHSFEAIFIKYERGKVRLVGADKESKDVELKRLSDADQEFVQSRIQSMRATLKNSTEGE